MVDPDTSRESIASLARIAELYEEEARIWFEIAARSKNLDEKRHAASCSQWHASKTQEVRCEIEERLRRCQALYG